MEVLRSFQDIKVELVGSIAQPYEVSVASARTCYSGTKCLRVKEW